MGAHDGLEQLALQAACFTAPLQHHSCSWILDASMAVGVGPWGWELNIIPMHVQIDAKA